MGKHHSYSFFSQKTGMIFNADHDDLFFFLKFLVKKDSGVWEKPSQGEGKSVKFGIEEAIQILKVLRKELIKWTTFHSFKEIKTSISFAWKDETAQELWINVGQRSKGLVSHQVEIFKLILEHIIKEQIEFGTSKPYVKEETTSSESSGGRFYNPQ